METTPIDTATAPDTFSVLSFIEEVAYPEASVSVYTDVQSARELAKVLRERLDVDDPDTDDAHNSKIEELEKKINASALTFDLRGFAPGVVNDLLEQHATDENPDGADAHLISKAVIRVKNAEGSVDEHMWTPEEAVSLKRQLAEGEYTKLLTAVAEVIFNAAVFTQVVDAGFLSGRPDVASEL